MTKYLTRTHKIHISKYHKYFKTIDDASFKAKNLYNEALFLERQQFFNKQPFYNNFDLYKILKTTDSFIELHNISSTLPQQTIKSVYETISSFKQTTKSYYNTPEKFKGKPKLPKYKHKIDGRTVLDFNYNSFTINNMININSLNIHLNIPKFLTGIQKKKQQTTVNIYEEDPKLELKQIRIIPKNDEYTIELIYTKQIEIPDTFQIYNAASIDLGINNFISLVTTLSNESPLLISGKYLKSYNKNFNKRLAHLKSKAKTDNQKDTTHQIRSLYKNRNNYFNTSLHQISSYIIRYLTSHNIQLLTIGYNEQWKQNSKLSKLTNQTFVQIPYRNFITMLQYKCEEHNIIFKTINEAYTSGTSFLDDECPSKEHYNKSRRAHRGLFTTNHGILINADVNASYQILKKNTPGFTNNPNFHLKPLNPIKLKPPEITSKIQFQAENSVYQNTA